MKPKKSQKTKAKAKAKSKPASVLKKAKTKAKPVLKAAPKAAPKALPKAKAPSTATDRIQALRDVIETVYRLRAPGGCPWDREQTHQSLRPYLIEEAYEVLDVLDGIGSADDLQNPKHRDPFKEELGDLLMQVLLHSEMTREAGVFDIYDVAAGLNDKLIRRHPHVFGETKAGDSKEALANWERQKAQEKAKNPEASVLDGLPKGMPALQKASRVIEKVTRVGFQWDDMVGPLEKVSEECLELRDEVLALQSAESEAEATAARKRVEDELGDLFFTLANVGYLLKIQPEDALRSTLAKFERRFRHVEKRIKSTGRSLEQSNLAEMDLYWDEAKRDERNAAGANAR